MPFVRHRPKAPEFEARQLDTFEACSEGLSPPFPGRQCRNLDTLPCKVSSRQKGHLGRCPSFGIVPKRPNSRLGSLTLLRPAVRAFPRLFQGGSAEISTLCRVKCQVAKKGIWDDALRSASSQSARIRGSAA